MCHPSRGPFSHRCPFTSFRASAGGYVVASLRDSRLYRFSPRPLATENYSAASVGALFWRAPQFNFTCGGEAFRVKVEFRPCFTGAGRFARLMSMGLLAKANTRKKEMGERGSLIASRDNRWLKRFRACLSGEEGRDGIVGVEGVRLVEAALGAAWRIDGAGDADSSDDGPAFCGPCRHADTAGSGGAGLPEDCDARGCVERCRACCRACRRAGSRKCGHDFAYGGSVWRDRSGDLRRGDGGHGESFCAKGATRVGGIGAAAADFARDVLRHPFGEAARLRSEVVCGRAGSRSSRGPANWGRADVGSALGGGLEIACSTVDWK